LHGSEDFQDSEVSFDYDGEDEDEDSEDQEERKVQMVD
jgi:hypothetical protein